MIFDTPVLVRHFGHGIPLERETTIMAGSPVCIAAVVKPSPWLKKGDKVEIEISKIENIHKEMVFEYGNNLPFDTQPPGC